MRNPRSPKDWLQEEIRFWSRNSQLEDPTISSEAEADSFVTRVRDWDFRKSEALHLHSPSSSPLEEIRIALARGYFLEAEKLIGESHQNEKLMSEGLFRSELLLEEARLFIFQGEWDLAINKIEETKKLSPISLSQMTLLQLRSLAYFEKGQFQMGLRDLEQIKVLQTLYPNAICGFYGRIMKSKFLARTGMIEYARTNLKNLWFEEKSRNTLDLVRVFTYLRAQSDLMRLEGIYHPSVSAAVMYLARQMGDSLYEALARAELFIADSEPSLEFQEILQQDQRDFSRVKRLMEEVKNGGTGISTTAKSLLLPQRIASKNLFHLIKQDPGALLLANGEVLLKLNPFKLILFDKLTKPLQLALELAKGPLTKKQAFAKVWGNQIYTPRLHDSVIHRTLSSLRKQFQLSVRIQDEQIELTDVFLVEVE